MILTTLPALALLLAMTACGPRPTAFSVAGAPAEMQVSPGDPQTSPQPGELGGVDGQSHDDCDDTPLDYHKYAEHWKDVDGNSLWDLAGKTMQKRSQNGVMQFRSGSRVYQARLGQAEGGGVETDYSNRLRTRIEFDGVEMPAQVVATRMDHEILFDTMVVNSPRGQIVYTWNEADSAWVAMEALRH